MARQTDHGYGNYVPPKEEKRHPLTRSDTEKLYQAAVQYPDVETELAVRVLLDYGLRVGELVHMREHWITQEYKRTAGKEVWRIKIPKVEYCWGGVGPTGGGNGSGANLHKTDQPCYNCRHRSWQKKVAPKNDDGDPQPDRGWITEQQAEEYDFAPKTERSATKVWQLGDLEESAETAQKLKQFLKAQPHEQWPHLEGNVNRHIDRVAEEADLTLPDRSRNEIVAHALRHTYGCRLVEASIAEGTAMKQMRHQDPDVFRWYADVRGTRVVSALFDAVSDNDSLLHE
jgi:integrase